MALWGSSTSGPLTGRTGDIAINSSAAVPGVDMFRLASNPLINIDADARQNAPKVGGGQHNDRPIGPFLVTLSPITWGPTGAPLSVLAPVAAFNWGQLVARVVFGRGGTKSEAWIDWPYNGGTFVVACDSLSVNAVALHQLAGAVGSDWDVRCGAWATPCPTGRGSLPPRYTMRNPDIPNGTSSNAFLIPPFARRWHFQWNNVVSQGAWIVDFAFRRNAIALARDQLIGGSATRGVLDTTVPGPWEVPTEATDVVITNNTVAALTIANPRIVFDLDLS